MIFSLVLFISPTFYFAKPASHVYNSYVLFIHTVLGVNLFRRF